jgi:hypothetical protein
VLFRSGGIPGYLPLDNVTLNHPPMIEVVNCTLRLQDSNLASLSCRGQSDIFIDDSDLMRLGLWGNETFVITNSSIGWLDSADGIVRSITIRDSRIDNATFTLEEEALIENSRIGQWDSGWFGWVGGTRRIAIRDSNFKILTIDSHTEYSLQNVTVENNVWVQPEWNGVRETYIAGDLDYRGKIPKFDWNPAESIFYKVIRQFEVKVTRGGAPLKSAVLTLRGENDAIWTSISDERGYARFNVTFGKIIVANPFPGQNPLVATDNMTKTLTLLIEDGGDKQNVTFGLFSNAPLSVSFESLTGFQSELVAISVVAILIASIAFAFSRLVRRRLT